MSDVIKIIIADDHPIFREGLKSIIEGKRNYLIEGIAENGDEVLRLINSKKPDIVILDIDMPGKNGFDVVKELNRLNLKTKIIFLTMHSAKDLFDEAISLGVNGFVLKENAVNEIIDAVSFVSKGKKYISPSMTEHLIADSGSIYSNDSNKLLLSKLTPAETKVLKLIAKQKITREIAEELFVSPKTVETHRTHITSKLNLKGQNSLLKFAIENKDNINSL